MSAKWWSRMIVSVSMAASVLGCGEPQFVGGECESNRDCDEPSVCLQGEMFPGGMCTLFCEDVAECTADSWCVTILGGTCMPECTVDEDCREGWECAENSTKGGSGGPVLICKASSE